MAHLRLPEMISDRAARRGWRPRAAACLPLIVMAALVGCGDGPTGGSGLRGTISVDGSSTVYPLTEAVAEEFRFVEPQVRLSVGESGTGGGFQKFAAGEIDICNASRPIRQVERQACNRARIEPLEFAVAYDGLSVVVHPENDWVDVLTVEQLRELWRPDSGIGNWRDLNPAWPDHRITLYGPGTDSGTFDYFTEVIVGSAGASRPDYFASEDDNQLVSGVANDRYALGYFGYAYYRQNAQRLKALAIDDGSGPVRPSPATIRRGTYRPLSRPLLIYARADVLSRPEVAAFVTFFLDNSSLLAEEVGYVPLSDEELQRQRAALAEALSRAAVRQVAEARP